MADGTYPLHELMYDRETGRTSIPEFMNDDTSEGWHTSPFETEAPAGMAVVMLDPLRLKTNEEEGKLSGPLVEIAARLKEDDNPVVMIVKFRSPDR